MKTDKRFAYALTIPAVLVLLSILIFPLIYSIFISFMSTAKGLGNLEFVGFKNYKEVFTSAIFLQALKNTVIFVISTIATTTIIGFGIALLLNEIKRGLTAFRVLLILPLAIAPTVSSLTWGMMFNHSFGVINYLLGLFGIPALGWAADIKTALLTLVIIDTWQWTPFVFIVLYSGMQMVSKENYESARIDGASRFQEIIHITIPLLKPIFIISIVFRFMDAFRSFDIIYVVTKGGPGDSTTTLVYRAFLESLNYYKLGVGATIGMVLLIVTFVIAKQLINVMTRQEG